MEEIDAENCLKLTGYPLQYFIDLTGIKGVHPGFKIEDAVDSAFYYHNDSVKVTIETNIVSELARTIYVKNLEITNEVMKKAEGARPGVALDILSEQVKQASSDGYKTIVTQAYRDLKKSPEYDGYAIWGRYGFVMSPRSQEKFLKLMQKHNRSETSIYELQSTEEGRSFWKNEGILWIGEFNLTENSYSKQCLTSATKDRAEKIKANQNKASKHR